MMPLYLVILALVMCGLVLGFYVKDNEKLGVSLVSPFAVLEVQDGLEIFEMRERELVGKSLDEWDKNLFKSKFILGISEEMKGFVFSDLIWEGRIMDGDFDKEAFLENVLYSVEERNGDFVLRRAKIGKNFLLRGVDGKAKVSFPVYYNFEFEKEYLISRSGGEIKVEVLG